jgi:capsule polysaccharide export protein KpsE/RkpR
LIADKFGGKDDVLALGEEEEAEQMLQILSSDEIRNRIIQKYDLMKHYDIDIDDKYKFTKLFKKYESNISYHRTEFMSVEIEVLDRNPDTAAMIANDIANLMDTVKNRMQKEIAREALKIVEDEYFAMLAYMQELEDSLNAIRAMGIHDPESQAEVLTQELAIAFRLNNEKAADKIQARLDVLSKYGGIYVSIRDNFEWDRKQLSYLKTKYGEAKIDAERSLEHKFVVNWAQPAEKKSYPIRWLIVVTSTIGSFLLTIFLLITFQSIKSLRLRDKAAEVVQSSQQ